MFYKGSSCGSVPLRILDRAAISLERIHDLAPNRFHLLSTPGTAYLVVESVGLINPSKREAEFTAFAAANSGALLRTARFLTGDHHHAEDLLQTTLTKTYVNWTAARGDRAHAYARRTMITTHTDTWRRRRWREELTDHHELASGTTTAGPTDQSRTLGSDPANAVTSTDSLQRTLAVLSQRERAVIVLRYCEDLSEQQTAQHLRISVGTVKTLHSRAMTKLRRAAPPPPRPGNGPPAETSPTRPGEPESRSANATPLIIQPTTAAEAPRVHH